MRVGREGLVEISHLVNCTGADRVTSRARTAAVAAALTTLALAAACWVIAVRQMDSMSIGSHAMAMGGTIGLGSLGFFVGVWVAMMAAMMLPGAVPAVVRRTRVSVRGVPLFLCSYIAVWTLFGIVLYEIYSPPGSNAAGAIVIAAGVYELSPIKRYFRARCRERNTSGLGLGVECVGSSVGLMAVLVALGVMSVTWMVVLALVIVAQKLLPLRAALDVPVALAILALGILLIVSPASVPAYTPMM
jgi:predicted metal-binding membrane protein